ncbi:unnamed protein product [Enterobius vermicularis]|uniref:Mitochondrial transcription termination factor family protein n=1 Tax=Enterobius vermicularis TaxID=51028 RepID=A0A0N4V9H3_ENTVE|nr:unnamed protein product [Enterobius vermicularis]
MLAVYTRNFYARVGLTLLEKSAKYKLSALIQHSFSSDTAASASLDALVSDLKKAFADKLNDSCRKDASDNEVAEGRSEQIFSSPPEPSPSTRLSRTEIMDMLCNLGIRFELTERALNLNLPALPRPTSIKDSVVRYDYLVKKWKFRRKMDSRGRTNDMDIATKGLSLDELDSDIYDRVSYLNLMSQYEEKERKRKLDELENYRRLREE